MPAALLDQMSDSTGRELFLLNKMWVLPEFVKEATVDGEEVRKALPATSFAYPEKRLFPIHTKADVLLSRLYFLKQAAHISAETALHIDKQLTQAEQIWGVALPQRISEAKPTGHTVIWKTAGQDDFSTTVSDEPGFRMVCSDILNGQEKYTLQTRSQMAQQLLKVALDLQIAPDEDMFVELQKLAGYGFCPLDTALQAINQRSLAIKDTYPTYLPILKTAAARLGEESKAGIVPGTFLQKVALVLDEVDRATGISACYARGFARPEEQLFPMVSTDFLQFRKIAAILPDGRTVNRDKLESQETQAFMVERLGVTLGGNEPIEKQAAGLSAEELEALYQFVQRL